MQVRLRNPDRDVEVSGPRKVRDVLAELGVDPDTVLVIRDKTLITREERVEDADQIEIRPVISGGSKNISKCKRCKAAAVIEIRRHNAAFCQPCFEHHFVEQVKRAVKSRRMIAPDDRVLVAVSGGKDSLALWDVLLQLDYRVSGLYLGLGIGEYSGRSAEVTRSVAAERDAELIEVDVAGEYGFAIATAGRKRSRSTGGAVG